MAVQVVDGVPVYYTLAAVVLNARRTCLEREFGVWSGDLGNACHLWEGCDHDNERKRGDHTPWSSDGPPDVVKAFDWTPPGGAEGAERFRVWLVGRLRDGAYPGCKFVNIFGSQYSGSGAYQGVTPDKHLHWSADPWAVNQQIDPVEDYWQHLYGGDDMPTPQELFESEFTVEGYKWLEFQKAIIEIYRRLDPAEGQLAAILAEVRGHRAEDRTEAVADRTRDEATRAVLDALAAAGVSVDTAVITAAIAEAAEGVKAEVRAAPDATATELADRLGGTTHAE